MGVTRTPLSIFRGKNAQLRCVTKSHGAIRPGMVDAVDFNNVLTMNRIPEFDNPVDALVYTTFDGGNGKISYTVNNQGQIQALVMDTDPTVEEIFVNPADMKTFTVFANLKGLDGKIKASYLLNTCTPVGNPWTSTVKEGAKQTLDFEYINGYYFAGLGILYTRARSATGPLGPPSQPVVAAGATGGALSDDTYYIRITQVTAAGESNGSNEAMVELTAGTAVQKITVTLPAISGSVTGHNVYVSNRSNDARYVATDATTSYDITALPSITAAACPNDDTTGAPQVANDKAFSSDKVILDIAAFKIPQTGLDYALIMKNGEVIASPDNPATQDDFFFNAAGTEFELRVTPSAGDHYDLFTLYQPS